MMKALAPTTVGIDSGENQTDLAPVLLKIAKLARCTEYGGLQYNSLVFANICKRPVGYHSPPFLADVIYWDVSTVVQHMVFLRTSLVESE